MSKLLKNRTQIKKPIKFVDIIDNSNDIIVQLSDYYRCLDINETVIDTSDNGDDDDDTHHGNENGNGEEDEEEEIDEYTDLYSKDKQKELSYTHPLLIKALGILESCHSITINLHGFKPFFYIKIPDNWRTAQCQMLIDQLRKQVYYKYRDHLINTKIIIRKPFSKFTGNDKFKFMRMEFINKEGYDTFAYKLANPIRVDGLNEGKPYKYDLYESNIDPIIKFIHLTKINPSGWIRVPKYEYSLVKNRTTLTDFEIKIQWDKIELYDKLEGAFINIMAFDIEADSSHGDFPIGIKNYQKLAQELVTMFNDCGINSTKTRAHHLFANFLSTSKVVDNMMRLVFDDNYSNSGIHQINTVYNIKPNPETIEQVVYLVYYLCDKEQHSRQTLVQQLTDIFEYNFPPLDVTKTKNSHYGLLADEIVSHLQRLVKGNNIQFKKFPLQVIAMLINLAFDDYFDGFSISNIYTKSNIKPDALVLESLVPSVIKIIHDCASFVLLKKLPDHIKESEVANISQNYFVDKLTELFDQYLPPVEGDKLIQIGSTFQLMGNSDCYLKHIICLNSCDPITNEEMITFENKGIYLPAEELASDLVMYEKQLGLFNEEDPKKIEAVIKNKIKEIKTWDQEYRKKQCQKAAEFRRIKQSSTDNARVIVECFDKERDLLLAWKELIQINDPDVVLGYNIFGFDFKFMYERALELDCADEFCQLGRLKNCTEILYEQKLSSAGLGDNTLKYIPMAGRVVIDLYKVVQKSYQLDSYKLDKVCHKFLYKEKVDLPPQQIFNLQKGTSADRKEIGIYCLVDCILCNRLALKLEIIGNNMAMANVCKVPFPYLFLRGQGVKIFSLVSDVCSKKGYLIPVLPKADPLNDDKYEGAIVLQPDTKVHFEPVGVGDFNSLYPNSMISENISHDSFVEIGGKYDNLPDYTYTDISYDVFKTETVPGKKKKIKRKVGVQTCRYAQLPNGEKSVLPSILADLLSARKDAKKKMEDETDPFKAKIWNGLQLAYKITANSLYGQCGAKTSPINKVEIAASTTAVGRQMIIFSKKHVETKYKDAIVTLDLACSGIYDPKTKIVNPTRYTGQTVHVKDSYCVYGDTDSVFIKFGIYTVDGVKIEGNDAVNITIALTKKVTKEISSQLKKPQNIEFEKTIYPFMLISKKKYHGHYYTKMDNPSFYPNSMGIVLKRRDNAPIVKHIFGGAVDIIMNEHNIDKSLQFVKDECAKLLNGQFPLSDFVISKTLKSYYKKPKQIAHNVLACRQAQRDPGGRFEPNDRVPYAYVVTKNSKEVLQGERIETPDFITQNGLTIDYKMYLTNQIINPVAQIFALIPGYENTEDVLTQMIDIYESRRTGNISMDNFIQKKDPNDKKIAKMSDIIKDKERRQAEEKNKLKEEADDDADDDINGVNKAKDSDEDNEDVVDEELGAFIGEESTSNYADPDF